MGGGQRKGSLGTEIIEYYVDNNDEDVRHGVAEIYQSPLSWQGQVHPDGHVPVGTVYKLVFVCPDAGLLECSRLPARASFGTHLIYSFAKVSTQTCCWRATCTPRQIEFCKFGWRRFGISRKVLPEDGKRNRRRKKRELHTNSHAAIATDFPTPADERIFLAAKLMLTHHFFFPHDRLPVRLFQILTNDAASVSSDIGLAEFVVTGDGNGESWTIWRCRHQRHRLSGRLL